MLKIELYLNFTYKSVLIEDFLLVKLAAFVEKSLLLKLSISIQN